MIKVLFNYNPRLIPWIGDADRLLTLGIGIRNVVANAMSTPNAQLTENDVNFVTYTHPAMVSALPFWIEIEVIGYSERREKFAQETHQKSLKDAILLLLEMNGMGSILEKKSRFIWLKFTHGPYF